MFDWEKELCFFSQFLFICPIFLNYFTMNYKTHKSIGGGVITLALATLFVNAAFADTSSDRLSTYKANKLIPDNISIKVGKTRILKQPLLLSKELGLPLNLVTLQILRILLQDGTWRIFKAMVGTKAGK